MSTSSHAAEPHGDFSRVRAEADTYDRVLSGIGGAALETLMHRQGPAAVGVALYAAPPYDLQVPALSVARLSVTLTPGLVTGGCAGDRCQRFGVPLHSMYLIPAGAPSRWRKALPSRHLNLYVHREAFSGDGLDVHRGGLNLEDPAFIPSVPGAKGLIETLLSEMKQGGPWAVEAADSLSRLILIRLARYQCRPAAKANPMTAQMLGRLREHVREHLAERILVSDLAAVAGLSANQFAHAYTTFTGQSPHQFVIDERLRRAVDLIRRSTLSLAAVSAECGFASQQHLTQLMRRRLGTTPGRFRDGAAERPKRARPSGGS